MSIFRHCQHLNTRCIHGDEILQAMKVYPFRVWKSEVVYRQRCLDCGKRLNRAAICVMTGKDIHEEHLGGQCNCSVHDITVPGAAHAVDCPMFD